MTRIKQTAIVLIGLAALAFLLIEPHFEGRNAHATVFEVYFKDPFLAFVYLASVPFFIGLYQAFRALGDGGERLKALRTIKKCALAMIGFVVVSFAFMGQADDDDRPAGIMMRLIVLVPSIGIAAAASKYGRALERR